MSKSFALFRCSAWDVLPAFAGIAIVAAIFWTFLCFQSLSWWVLVPAFLVIMGSYCWNLQCISHNFIHNPYFTSNWLNRAYSVLETLALGVPHVLYHHYHMNHHWGDNDEQRPGIKPLRQNAFEKTIDPAVAAEQAPRRDPKSRDAEIKARHIRTTSR